MSVIATALKHLLAAGLSGEALLHAIEEIENAVNALQPITAIDEQAERRRAKDRERKALRNSAESAETKKVSPFPLPLSPAPLTPTPISPSKKISLAEFSEFWAVYPRKTGKGAAEKAYRIARRQATAEVLLEAAKRFADSVAAEDPKFIPHPATWLNQKRWLDEIAPQPEASKPVDISGEPEWKQEIAKTLGNQILTWLKDGEREGGTLVLTKAYSANFLRDRYAIQLAKLGITEITHRGNHERISNRHTTETEHGSGGHAPGDRSEERGVLSA